MAWHFQWFHALGLVLPLVLATVLAALSLVLVRRWNRLPSPHMAPWKRFVAAISMMTYGAEAIALAIWTATHPRSEPHPGILLMGLVCAGLTGLVVVALAGWTWIRTPLRPTTAVGLLALLSLAALVVTPLAASRAKVSTASTWIPVSWDWSYRLLPVSDDAADYTTLQCNDTTCLAFGPGLDPTLVGVVSTDGGLNWSELHSTLRPPASSYSAPGSLSCWNDGADCLAAGSAGPSGPVLMKSIDEGRSWATVVKVAGIFPQWVSCFAGGKCFASGNSTAKMTPGSAELSSVLDYSSNGGSTWTGVSLPPGTWRLGGVTCPTTSTCYLTASDVKDAKHQVLSLLASHDGGLTWNALSLPSDVGEIGGASCADSKHCVIEAFAPDNSRNSIDGTLQTLSTANGGDSWSSTPIARNMAMGPMTCPTISNCLIASTSVTTWNVTVYASSDGGDTWRSADDLLPPNLTVYSIGCGYFATSEKCRCGKAFSVSTGSRSADYPGDIAMWW
ncbi:MAG: sialidase family protein [Acidimicrobiales bacterium]